MASAFLHSLCLPSESSASACVTTIRICAWACFFACSTDSRVGWCSSCAPIDCGAVPMKVGSPFLSRERELRKSAISPAQGPALAVAIQRVEASRDDSQRAINLACHGSSSCSASIPIEEQTQLNTDLFPMSWSRWRKTCRRRTHRRAQLFVCFRNKSSPRQVTSPIGPRAQSWPIGEETMHTLFFKSIAGSLAALALGVSVATTPASAHGGGGGGAFHGGFGGGASMAASAAEASMAASAAEASMAASATEGSVLASATEASLAASAPITAVMAIAATAMGTMAMETACRISRLCTCRRLASERSSQRGSEGAERVQASPEL